MADEEQEVPVQEESEQTKKDKISKKYAEVMRIVTQVVGGEKNLRPAKTLQPDVTARVVAELFQQEQQDLEASALVGLKDLLKKYVEYQSEMNKKKAEIEKLDLQKKKEFTEAANKWLQVIDRGAVMQESYVEALKVAFTEVKEEAKK